MKYFYDRDADSLYLTLVDAGAYEDSVEAAPGVVLDFDSRGRLVGIDIEHASKTIDVTDLELREEPSDADASAVRVTGAKLKKEREKLGLTQSELSQKLNVSANTIARWERGELKIEHAGMLQLALRALAGEATGADYRTYSVRGNVSPKATSQLIVRNAKTRQYVAPPHSAKAKSISEPLRASKKR